MPILGAAAILTFFWFAGWRLDPRLVITGGLAVFSTTSLYILSIFRNYIVLDTNDVRIASWLANPFKEFEIPYDSILEMEADETANALRITFVNQLGERDHAGIVLDKVGASDVKDQIRARQSGAEPPVLPEAPPPVIDQQGLPTKKQSIKFEVWRMPSWVWFLAGAAPVVATVVLIANSFDLTPLRIFGTTVFFEAIVLAIFFFVAQPKRFELRADKLIISQLNDYHRIPYEDIMEVTPYETGYLVVEYTKRSNFGFGGGDETASIRLLKHSDSAIAAAYIRAAVERAKYSAN